MRQLTEFIELIGKTIIDVVEGDDGTLLVFDDNSFALLSGWDDGSVFIQDACELNASKMDH